MSIQQRQDAPETQGNATLLPDILRQRAIVEPDTIALLVHERGSLSLRDWDEQSDVFAAALMKLGINPRNRVGLLFDNKDCISYAKAYVGVHKAGAVAIPLWRGLADREIQRIERHSDMAVLVHAPGMEVPSRLRCRPIQLDSVCCASLTSERTFAQRSTVDLSPDDIAEIIYTSGTTGSAKGVAVSHLNIALEKTLDDPLAAQHEILLHALPLGTNFSQTALRAALGRRHLTIVMEAFEAEQFCWLIERYRVTEVVLVPAMAISLLGAAGTSRYDLSSVQSVALSAAPTAPAVLTKLAQTFGNARLSTVYTSTEAWPAATEMAYTPDRPGSVGRPRDGQSVAIVDADGRDVAANEIGEVELRAGGVPRRAYYRDANATAEVFVETGVRMGDLGYLDTEGFLFLVDRKADVINVGGFKVSSIAVENALAEHPAVAEAAVFGVADAIFGQRVAAAVVCSANVAPATLAAFVRARVGDHEAPTAIFVVDELPRSLSGKVAKRRLRDLFGRDARLSGRCALTHVDPVTDTEAVLCAIWKQVLAQPSIGVTDDFFDLAGDSLQATQVIVRARQEFGLDLPLRLMFEHPVLRDLAAHLEAMRVGESSVR